MDGREATLDIDVQQFDEFQDYDSEKSSMTQGSLLNDEKEYYVNMNTQDKLVANPDDSASLLSTSFRIKEMITDELKSPANKLNCSQHPDQETNYYNFGNNQLLCSECIKTENYDDQQVLNFKRAGVKIRRMVDELLYEIDTKSGFYNITEKRIEAKKEDLKDLFGNHAEQVTSIMNVLRQKIDKKQEELMSEINDTKSEKLAEFDSLLAKNRKQRQEADDITALIKNTINTLDDANVCEYYSQKVTFIKSFLEEQDHKLVDNTTHILLNHKNEQEQFSLKRFNEQMQILLIQVNTLSGIIDAREPSPFKDFESRINELRYNSSLIRSNSPDRLKKDNDYDHNPAKSFNSFIKSQDKFSPAKVKTSLYSEVLGKFNEKPQNIARERSKDIFRLLDDKFGSEDMIQEKEVPTASPSRTIKETKNPSESLRESLTNLIKKVREAPKREDRIEIKFKDHSPDSRRNSTSRVLNTGFNTSYQADKVSNTQYASLSALIKPGLGLSSALSYDQAPKSALSSSFKLQDSNTYEPFRTSLRGTQLENVFNTRGKSISGLERDLNFLKASISKVMLHPGSNKASTRYSDNLRMKFFK